MKHALTGLILAVAAAKPDPAHFRYQRQITTSAAGQTCVVLPTDVYAHAAESLADVRLYRDTNEVPYALPQGTPPPATGGELTPLNLGTRDGTTVFNVAMPGGNYSDVVLHVTRKDYIATVEVSGSQHQDGSDVTRLGSYKIFDLGSQRLGSSGVLHLPTSDFRYLHVRVSGPVQPNEITGVSAGQQTAADVPYTTVTETSVLRAKPHESIVELAVPAHVPVDRVLFVPSTGPVEFSRPVRVTVTGDKPERDQDDSAPSEQNEFTGRLLRLHREVEGKRIDEEQISIDTSATYATATRWQIMIENGDDPPLPLEAVRLQMHQQKLCFQAAPGTYRLMYGDAVLARPQYDYASLFTLHKDSATALLAAEEGNPEFHPRADKRPFSERHPALLWCTLVAAVLLLGSIALRSGKTPGPDQ